jgi:hypothetical protein
LAPPTQKPKNPQQGFLHSRRIPVPQAFAKKVVQRELLPVVDVTFYFYDFLLKIGSSPNQL